MNPLADGSASDVLASVLGVDVILGMFIFWPLLVVMLFALRDPAPRLSHRVDLALPDALRRRLNRFLRLRIAARALGLIVLSQLLLALAMLHSGLRTSHVAELALLPAAIWLPCLLVSLWPRWRSRGPVHLAHLRRLTVRDALTDGEWAAVAAAYTADATIIVWALTRAGLATWSAVAVAALACQLLLSYATARRVMAAPAAGSDTLELAWDDVLRLQRVRSLVASSSFATLWALSAAAGDLAGVTGSRYAAFLIPLMGVTSVAAGAWVRSAAHRNWRRAWPASRP